MKYSYHSKNKLIKRISQPRLIYSISNTLTQWQEYAGKYTSERMDF